jgi:hypothetical protein
MTFNGIENGVEKERTFTRKFEVYSRTRCLRCGQCCFQWGVNKVPGLPSGYKPEQTDCPHLKSAEVKDGQWTLADCSLREKKPRECATFFLPPTGGVCPIGLFIWKERAKEAALPTEIRELIED